MNVIRSKKWGNVRGCLQSCFFFEMLLQEFVTLKYPEVGRGFSLSTKLLLSYSLANMEQTLPGQGSDG